MLKYAVIGDSGMFGAEMIEFLRLNQRDVIGFNRTNLALDAFSLDEVLSALEGIDVIINGVAFTDVDAAEINPVDAYSTNGYLAGNLAEVASLLGAKYFHISTDYVFDGAASRPYLVSDTADPQTQYGKSKALGERLISESDANYTILRTAWLYGKFGRCFPKVIAEAIEKNGSVRVVGDQFGQPTWARDLAEQVFAYSLVQGAPKIVHAVASGKASWAEFAVEIANSQGLIGGDVVTPITSSEYQKLARRPAWSVLDNSSDFIEPIGDWRERWMVAADQVLGTR